VLLFIILINFFISEFNISHGIIISMIFKTNSFLLSFALQILEYQISDFLLSKSFGSWFEFIILSGSLRSWFQCKYRPVLLLVKFFLFTAWTAWYIIFLILLCVIVINGDRDMQQLKIYLRLPTFPHPYNLFSWCKMPKFRHE
jgi:hypothetical protein